METPETVHVEGVTVVSDPSTGRVHTGVDALGGVQYAEVDWAQETPEWLNEVLHVLTGLANREQDKGTLTPGHALAALANVPADVLDAAGCHPTRPTRWSGVSFSTDTDALAYALASLPNASVDINGTFTDASGDDWTRTNALLRAYRTDTDASAMELVEYGVVSADGITVRPGVDWVPHVQAARRQTVRRRRVLVVEDWQDVPRD